MKGIAGGILLVVAAFIILGAGRRDQEQASVRSADPTSFANDVAPILQEKCLRCHDEDKPGPSELYLDSYSLLMTGGKHGIPVVPGKPDDSILYQKLKEDPPFGDRMPLKKRSDPVGKYLSDDEMSVLAEWIRQGAKDN
jgi:hypothetical protein